jgi:hypothetical protein
MPRRIRVPKITIIYAREGDVLDQVAQLLPDEVQRVIMRIVEMPVLAAIHLQRIFRGMRATVEYVVDLAYGEGWVRLPARGLLNQHRMGLVGPQQGTNHRATTLEGNRSGDRALYRFHHGNSQRRTPLILSIGARPP